MPVYGPIGNQRVPANRSERRAKARADRRGKSWTPGR